MRRLVVGTMGMSLLLAAVCFQAHAAPSRNSRAPKWLSLTPTQASGTQVGYGLKRGQVYNGLLRLVSVNNGKARYKGIIQTRKSGWNFKMKTQSVTLEGEATPRGITLRSIGKNKRSQRAWTLNLNRSVYSDPWTAPQVRNTYGGKITSKKKGFSLGSRNKQTSLLVTMPTKDSIKSYDLKWSDAYTQYPDARRLALQLLAE